LVTIAIISEGSPLVDRFPINSSEQIVYTKGITNKFFIGIANSWMKVFNCLERFEVDYVLVFCDVVSVSNEGKKAGCV